MACAADDVAPGSLGGAVGAERKRCDMARLLVAFQKKKKKMPDAPTAQSEGPDVFDAIVKSCAAAIATPSSNLRPSMSGIARGRPRPSRARKRASAAALPLFSDAYSKTGSKAVEASPVYLPRADAETERRGATGPMALSGGTATEAAKTHLLGDGLRQCLTHGSGVIFSRPAWTCTVEDVVVVVVFVLSLSSAPKVSSKQPVAGLWVVEISWRVVLLLLSCLFWRLVGRKMRKVSGSLPQRDK